MTFALKIIAFFRLVVYQQWQNDVRNQKNRSNCKRSLKYELVSTIYPIIFRFHNFQFNSPTIVSPFPTRVLNELWKLTFQIFIIDCKWLHYDQMAHYQLKAFFRDPFPSQSVGPKILGSILPSFLAFSLCFLVYFETINFLLVQAIYQLN